jgi:hypothetical protein
MPQAEAGASDWGLGLAMGKPYVHERIQGKACKASEAIRMPCSTHLQRLDAVGRGGQLVGEALRLALQLLPLLLAELGRRAAGGRRGAAAAAAGDAGEREDG